MRMARYKVALLILVFFYTSPFSYPVDEEAEEWDEDEEGEEEGRTAMLDFDDDDDDDDVDEGEGIKETADSLVKVNIVSC